MIHLLETAQAAVNTVKEAEQIVESGKIDLIIQKLIDLGISAGKNILMAIVVYIVGRFIVSMINKFVANMLERRKVEVTIQTFLKSLINILLMILLVVSVVSALGINTTSFAALLASAGVAIGMALSGNLQNLAGGLIILLFKPYKVGDWIEAQGTSGSVSEIQIFHTILTTADNKVVYIPNGSLSSGIVTIPVRIKLINPVLFSVIKRIFWNFFNNLKREILFTIFKNGSLYWHCFLRL